MSQLTLFETSPPVPPDPAAAQLQRVHQEASVLAARLPGNVHFGTSSWGFP